MAKSEKEMKSDELAMTSGGGGRCSRRRQASRRYVTETGKL